MYLIFNLLCDLQKYRFIFKRNYLVLIEKRTELRCVPSFQRTAAVGVLIADKLSKISMVAGAPPFPRHKRALDNLHRRRGREKGNIWHEKRGDGTAAAVTRAFPADPPPRPGSCLKILYAAAEANARRLRAGGPFGFFFRFVFGNPQPPDGCHSITRSARSRRCHAAAPGATRSRRNLSSTIAARVPDRLVVVFGPSTRLYHPSVRQQYPIVRSTAFFPKRCRCR